MEGIALDRMDVQEIAAVHEAIKVLQDEHNIVVRTITYDVYAQHRVRASRRSRWNPLCITKIVRL